MPKKYDVIIIGAGIGGLTAGAILAKNGKKVLVLEKNSVAGGYAVNFKRGGFKFDATLHVINGCGEDGLTYKVLKEAGVTSKIRFIKPKFNSRLIYPDNNLLIPQCDIPSYLSLLIREFPQEANGIKDLFKSMVKIFEEVQRFYYANISLKLSLPFFPLKYPNLFSYVNKTVEQQFNKFIKDEKLKSIIAQSWLYFGLPTTSLSAIFFSYAWYDFFNNGVYFPEGGSESLVDALSDSIKENGGDILLNTEVIGFTLKALSITSVKTKQNDFFSGEVISNIDPYQTFLNFIEPGILPNSYVKLIKNSDISTSAITIYAGLKDTQFNEFSDDYEIFISNNYNTEAQFKSCNNNNPKEVTFSLGLHYNLQKNNPSNENKVISISTSSAYKYWASLSKLAYEEEKKRYADIILLRVKEYMPNLYNNICLVNVSTPLSLERYTKNSLGATYGLSQNVSQGGLKRLAQTTPIKNLFLSGAWTQPGGGICGVMLSGMHSAGIILGKNFYTEPINNTHFSNLLNKIEKS